MAKITPEQINSLQKTIKRANKYGLKFQVVETDIIKELVLLHVQIEQRIKQIQSLQQNQQNPINEVIIKELKFLLTTKGGQ